jgi:hypothetical protein
MKVWNSTLDNRFLAEVIRVVPYKGTLIIYDGLDKNKVIFEAPVAISYDSMFGPDREDVALWQEVVVDFIDNTYNKDAKGGDNN